MITQRVWFAVVATGMVLAAGSGWASGTRNAGLDGQAARRPAYDSSQAPVGEPAPRAAFDLFSALEPAPESHLDVYGNEIEDAITDYRVDTQGAIYENHSPDTEVPRLGPPIG